MFPLLYPNRSLDSGAFHSRWSEQFGWTRTDQTHWRLNWLRSAGLISRTSAGSYALTAQGKALAEELTLNAGAARAEPVTAETPSLQVMIAQHRASIRDELRQRLMQMSPSQFEHFAATLLEALGFSEIEVTRRSGDGGIDGQGTMRIGIVTVRAAFQCKRWARTVGRREIDAFRGTISGTYDQGVFVATSTFSSQAQEASIRRAVVPIILVDGDRIADAMIQHGVGVTRRPLELLAVDESFFAANEEQTS